MTLRQTLLAKWGGPQVHPIDIENGISPTRQNEVIRFYRKVLEAHDQVYRPQDFSAEVNLATYNTPQGSLPKRVERVIYNLHDKLKLTDEEKKELDTICAEIGRICSNNHEDLGIHVSRRCWWEAGTCGDNYSCWFGNNRYHIKEMHTSLDFLAFTVWSKKGNALKPYADMIYPKPVNDLMPAGRMWLWFDHKADDYFAAVSAYGLPGEKQIALLQIMCPDHVFSYGAHVIYPNDLYDNGGYTFRPKGKPEVEAIRPLFGKAK